LEVKADSEYDFYELINHYIRPLQNLLTLATMKPNSILELNVYSKQVSFEKNEGGSLETPIQLFFQQRHFNPRLGHPLVPDDMLFTLQDLPDGFQSAMERWFRVSDELDSVCSLFFAVQYTPSLYLENKFLNIVQAFESYHRRRMKNEVLPKAEYRSLKSGILKKVDAEQAKWLEPHLAYSNEPRLEHRLIELTERVSEALVPLVSNKQAFAKMVKDTRNYLTHYDGRLKSKAASGGQLFWLTQKLSYLLQACLLMELGIPLEQCTRLLRRNQAFIFAMGQSSSES
jgi:hypothetical protein